MIKEIEQFYSYSELLKPGVSFKLTKLLLVMLNTKMFSEVKSEAKSYKTMKIREQLLFFKSYLAIGLFLFSLCAVHAQNSSDLVYMDGGSLNYNTYANEGETNEVNKIPDFSYVGYKKGGVPLPEVPVEKTISPVSGDNTQSIQNAIDYVESLPLNSQGIRGAVLLEAGNYPINGELNISKSGVILRGEGQGNNGTVLKANKTENYTFLRVYSSSSSGLSEITSTTQQITTSYVGVGSKTFDIADASAFSVGDLVSVKKTVNQKWIDDLGMSQMQLCGNIPSGRTCNGWTPEEYTIKHERVITGISGNTITIDIPIVDAMESQYGGGAVSKASSSKISNCGVENLRIESAYTSETDEDHGWIAIYFRKVTNSWVKNVTAQYFGYSAVTLALSDFNTIQDCAMLDYKSIITGGRRYGFNIGSGIGNLFQRCYTREGRHDFSTGGQVTGPNVFLDCYAENTHADMGPHQRWATGILYDNIRGGQIRVQNRGYKGTGHGWAGAQNMFWNLKSYKDEIKVESPVGAKNWGIGCEGHEQKGAGYWESWNVNVSPRSLYLQQLKDRLGQQAVDNITITPQKTGNIYAMLAAWAGEGELNQSNLGVLSTAEDAYVRDGSYSSNNYGNYSQLRVKGTSGADYNRTSFIKFNLSNISRSVSSAKIRIKVNGDAGGTHPSQNLKFVADDNWTEGNITWNNKPTEGNSIDIQNLPSNGGWIEFDVTSQVNNELNGDDVLSAAVTGMDNYVSYYSSNTSNVEDRPQFTYELTPQTTLTPAEDAYVRDGSYASNNYGNYSQLRVKGSTGTDYNRTSFIKFNLSNISGSVSSAKIRLKVNGDAGGAHPSQNLKFVADDNWTEGNITWNNKPTEGNSIDIQNLPSNGGWIEFDVTSQVNNELNGDDILSIAVTGMDNYVSYYSSNTANAENRPRLVLVMGNAPLLNKTLSTIDLSLEKVVFKIYPNPVVKNISIESNQSIGKLDIFNLAGKLFFRNWKIPEKDKVIHVNINNLPAGIYLLRLESNTGGIETKKFIKQ